MESRPIINANVLIETGYMLSLGKNVSVLKDSKIRKLPTDISNLIHKTYSYESLLWSLTKEIMKWCEKDNNLFGAFSIRRDLRTEGRDFIVYIGGSIDFLEITVKRES